MCFDNDADWFAEIHESEHRIAAKELACHECGRTITPGEEFLHVYMQEHECCQHCDDEDDSCEHDYGEMYTYKRCEVCSKILDAIEKSEEEEGCPPYSRRPMLEELPEVFSYFPDSKRYAAKCVEMHPELIDHPWIKRVYSRDSFEEEE